MFKEGYIDKVYYRYFSVENPAANIVAIHGLGGHCIWFDSAAILFNKKGFNFFSFDLPGFGQSMYERGNVSNYNDWVDTSFTTIKTFLVDFGVRKPVFILGHSMGSLVSLILSNKIKANGWIFSVPGFSGNPKLWPFVNVVFPIILKGIFTPNKKIMMPFGPELITRDKETLQKIKKDKLRVIAPSAKLLLEVHSMTKTAKKNSEFFSEPFLLLEAGKDMVCSNEAMDMFFDTVKSKDKSKKIYHNAYHDLFVEEELSLIVDDVAIWIENKI